MKTFLRKTYIAERFGVSRRTVDRYLKVIRDNPKRYPGATRQVLNRVEIDIDAFRDALGIRG